MSKTYSIQQAAARTGLSIDTLRYYERIGLLAPIARNQSGHRRYSEDRLTGIEFVVRLRDTGMSVAELKYYIALSRRGDSTLAERRTMLEKHAQHIKAQIEQLTTTQQAIDYKLTHFDEIAVEVAALHLRLKDAQVSAPRQEATESSQPRRQADAEHGQGSS
jgi:DNA-binding transcriptional MerR regulator